MKLLDLNLDSTKNLLVSRGKLTQNIMLLIQEGNHYDGRRI